MFIIGRISDTNAVVSHRFNLVQRTAQACTALAFNLRRKSEFLVALADYSVKCFDSGKKSLFSLLKQSKD